MDKLLDDLMREVERWERAYRLLPCDEIRQRLHEARLRLSRGTGKEAGIMTARGDDRKLMHWVASHGYTVVRASSGHWKVYDNDVLLMATSGTPSDWRSRHNFIRDLRRRTCSI